MISRFHNKKNKIFGLEYTSLGNKTKNVVFFLVTVPHKEADAKVSRPTGKLLEECLRFLIARHIPDMPLAAKV